MKLHGIQGKAGYVNSRKQRVHIESLNLNCTHTQTGTLYSVQFLTLPYFSPCFFSHAWILSIHSLYVYSLLMITVSLYITPKRPLSKFHQWYIPMPHWTQSYQPSYITFWHKLYKTG